MSKANLVQFTKHGKKIQRIVQDRDIPLADAKRLAREYAEEPGEKGVYVVEVNGIAVFRAPERMRAWERA